MDTKSREMKTIKNLRGEIEDEGFALTGVEVSNSTKYNEVEHCGVLKTILQWQRQNPMKTILISIFCVSLVLGITGFVVVHTVLDRNVPSAFLNMAHQYESTHRVSKNATFEEAINGHWIEDYDQRENMDSYLYQMGMAWFKRSYANSVSWEDELLISIEDGKLTMNGLRGPFAEAYEYIARVDNATLNLMDTGDFGGITNSITELRNNSMISYVFKPDSTSDLFFTVENTIDIQNDVDEMKVEYTHFDSNVVWKSIFRRNYGDDQESEESEYFDDNYDDIWGDDDDWK